MNSAGQRFLSIRRRLLRRIFWLALSCGSLAVLVQALSVYHTESLRFQSAVEHIGETHVPLLMVGLWDLETEALRQQLQQISERREVAQVVLESNTQLRLSAGSLAHAKLPDARLPIPHPRHPEQRLGELLIYANPVQLHKAILWVAAQRILEVTLFTALICLVIAYHLHCELGRPLRRIARYAANLSPHRTKAALKLKRPSRDWYDEIDLVVAGFETLRQGLQHYASERDSVTRQLATERDQLDQRVEQRTATLQRINGYLDIFSRTLMQCIHLRPEGYQEAMQQTLKELACYIGADTCGLAERQGNEAWHWQVLWQTEQGMPYALDKALFEPDNLNEGWLKDQSDPNAMAYPIERNGQGSLLLLRSPHFLDDTDERRYQQMAAEMLFSLLERWQHALQLETNRQELERLSRSDPLTGLANRRHFDENYHQEVSRAIRHELPLSVLMMDVDHFKAYNDRYGHGQGDTCLIQVANCLDNLFQRAGELPARLGGEEFAVLLPGETAAQAQEAAERLRRAILELNIAHAGSPLGQVTISVGFAALGKVHYQRNTGHGLLELADKALYAAKASGRNSVCGELDNRCPARPEGCAPSAD